MTPVLMLMLLFVLWAGRSGQIELAADLAAEEAATLAALCCDMDDDESREDVVEQMLESKTSLASLCRPHGIVPTDRQAGFVTSQVLESGGLTTDRPSVGVLEVAFTCVTDAAVMPLQGYLGSVEIQGRANEAFLGTASADAPQTPSERLPKLNVVGFYYLQQGGSTNIKEELVERDANGKVKKLITKKEGEASSATQYGLKLSIDCPVNWPVVVRVRPLIDPSQQGLIARPGFAWPGVNAQTGDYKYFDEEVVLYPGECDTFVPITVFNDSIDEYDEELKIVIEVLEGAIATTNVATLVLADDDPPPFLVLWRGPDGPWGTDFIHNDSTKGRVDFDETDNYTNCDPGSTSCQEKPSSLQFAVGIQAYLAQQPDDPATKQDEREIFPNDPWNHYTITEKYLNLTCSFSPSNAGQRATRGSTDAAPADVLVPPRSDAQPPLSQLGQIEEDCNGVLWNINPCLPREICRESDYFDNDKYKKRPGYYWTRVGLKILNDGCKDGDDDREYFNMDFTVSNSQDLMINGNKGGTLHRLQVEIVDDEDDSHDRCDTP